MKKQKKVQKQLTIGTKDGAIKRRSTDRTKSEHIKTE